MLFPPPKPAALWHDDRPADHITPAERAALPPAAYFTTNTVLYQKTGTGLEWKQLKEGKFDVDGEESINGYANELGLLAQGKTNNGPGTNTMHFTKFADVPSDQKVTLPRLVCTLQPLKKEVKRVRLTVRGDLVDYPGNKSTPGGDLSTCEAHLNSILSTPG